jgi:hypothetical protein
MSLSIYVAPNVSSTDIYAVYISYSANESLVEAPTEFHFDLLYVMPNETSQIGNNAFDEELRHTILLTPDIHFGNGTYIIGVKLFSKSLSNRSNTHRILRIDASGVMNLTDYNSTYTMNMYISKCQYWNEEKFSWNSDGCQVS